MQEGDSSSLDQAPAFFDMVWLICVSDIPVKPTRLQSLSPHSSFWPYHSSEGRGSSIHGHFDEIKEREALTSVLICSIVEPWKCKLLAQKSEWIQDADQGKVNFFPVSSPVSQQILNADPKCWGEEMKWGGEKKQQQQQKKPTDLLYDTVQSLWAADVETDENSIWVRICQRSHVIVIRWTCGYTITYGIRSRRPLRNSSVCLF